jgi:hypothetical protein
MILNLENDYGGYFHEPAVVHRDGGGSLDAASVEGREQRD